jgi:hypothetical protein
MIDNLQDKWLSSEDLFLYIKFFNFLFGYDVIDDSFVDKPGDPFTIRSLKGESMFDGELSIWDIFTIYNQMVSVGYLSGLKIQIKLNDFERFKIRERIKEWEDKERKQVLLLMTKIKDGEFLTLNEGDYLSGIDFAILDHIRFIPFKPGESDIEVMFRNAIDSYLDKFLNNNLMIGDCNYYKFEKQKSLLIEIIKGLNFTHEDYGNTFIIVRRVGEYWNDYEFPSFSVLHTLYALEKEEYLKVLSVYRSIDFIRDKNNVLLDTQIYINVRVSFNELFIQEIGGNSYKDDDKVRGLDAQINTSEQTWFFNNDTALLEIGGLEISFLSAPKQRKLLEGINSNKGKSVWVIDEIVDTMEHYEDAFKDKPLYWKKSLPQTTRNIMDNLAKKGFKGRFIEYRNKTLIIHQIGS